MSELRRISEHGSPVRADVVFVHGLGGDAFKTWCHDEENLHDSWPYWLAEEFPKVCVWSLDYAASPVKSGILGTLISKATRGRIESGQAMSLPEQATEVLEELVRNKLGEYPILFICHSLGGLLAKQLLLKAYDASNEEKHAIFEKTRSVLFLATPHMGAALASLARAFKRIFQQRSVLKRWRPIPISHSIFMGGTVTIRKRRVFIPKLTTRGTTLPV